jgi:hypothetical protein
MVVGEMMGFARNSGVPEFCHYQFASRKHPTCALNPSHKFAAVSPRQTARTVDASGPPECHRSNKAVLETCPDAAPYIKSASRICGTKMPRILSAATSARQHSANRVADIAPTSVMRQAFVFGKLIMRMLSRASMTDIEFATTLGLVLLVHPTTTTYMDQCFRLQSRSRFTALTPFPQSLPPCAYISDLRIGCD